jgi:hypothetical protein
MEQLIELEFDIFKAIITIENDSILTKIFRDYVPSLSFNDIKLMAKNNTLESSIIEIIENFFEDLIKGDSKILEKYQKIDLNKSKPKLSRYYGKKKVMSDIIKNGTKSELDNVLLTMNDLRNLMCKVRNKAIKDKNNNTNFFRTEDCRTIVSAFKILEKRVSPIINKKKISHD